MSDKNESPGLMKLTRFMKRSHPLSEDPVLLDEDGNPVGARADFSLFILTGERDEPKTMFRDPEAEGYVVRGIEPDGYKLIPFKNLMDRSPRVSHTYKLDAEFTEYYSAFEFGSPLQPTLGARFRHRFGGYEAVIVVRPSEGYDVYGENTVFLLRLDTDTIETRSPSAFGSAHWECVSLG